MENLIALSKLHIRVANRTDSKNCTSLAERRMSSLKKTKLYLRQIIVNLSKKSNLLVEFGELKAWNCRVLGNSRDGEVTELRKPSYHGS